ncbi:MAG: DEAD/DEAH box helicase [Bacteroidales bacterium]|nr:DEAD/DEAH box helicase [Bacteroidales bacterium]
MSLTYKYADFINLYVKGRISLDDARRQMRTAKAILNRINNQPGIILADEVGMGKTFVALAVACSIYSQDSKKRPIIIMVPSSLKEKWPRDFQLFKERCINEKYRDDFSCIIADRAEGFLKLLDNPVERQKSLIFLTHGAMSRGLSDGWIKLALIQRVLKGRRNTQLLKSALNKLYGRLFNMQYIGKKKPGIWDLLLRNRPEKWLKILQAHGIDPENDNNPDNDDDPIPQAIIDVLDKINTSAIFNALNSIPLRKSKYYEQKFSDAKRTINQELKKIWIKCLKELKVTLPLLIMDEAHHLKNSQTVLASLFKSSTAKDDSEMIQKDGALASVFERMLFLTATPFQLGHAELCNVLQRFTGISWNKTTAPEGGLNQFQSELDKLKLRLDEAQMHAINLDKYWSHLTKEDLRLNSSEYDNEDDWWKNLIINQQDATYTATRVFENYIKTKDVISSTQKYLQKWVIRHTKDKFLPSKDIKINRRKRLIGNQILNEDTLDSITKIGGIDVTGKAVLPFLLSARLTALTPTSRPVFSEGLASSYEAFMQTRLLRRQGQLKSVIDVDDDPLDIPETLDDSEWYLKELGHLLPSNHTPSKIEHPKIAATVNKVVGLWLRGEKVLVFCHYIATGKALRNYISEAISNRIISEGAKKLRCSQEDVMDELDRIGKRFLSEETIMRREIDKELDAIVSTFPIMHESENRELIIDVIRRYLRTPSFLVRFFPLGSPKMDAETFIKALNTKDASGLTLRGLIDNFLNFLETRCEKTEKESYISALSRIQPGGIRGKDLISSYSSDELELEQQNVKFMTQPSVRLVNGATKQETRQKLMLTFNTPFYPDILIASSVMAEGVDLHLNCRHIIHHDLCWNPSTLEQRTGRVDRIGSKAESCLEPIHVYIPYISETQDEKMYRVVMDRERWFKVVMGEKYSLDARSTEKIAERIPIPLSLAEELSFKLGV